MDSGEKEIQSFPLFKGCTRVPLTAGVPTNPLIVMLCFVAVISMVISPFCWFLVIPLYVVMRAITATDDKAFRILWLRIDSKMRNANKRVWGASSYSPIQYKKRRFGK